MSERDDYIVGRLLDRDDEAAWRESREDYEAQRAEDLALDHRPVSNGEMRDRWARDRAAVESASAEAHEAEQARGQRRQFPLEVHEP